MPAVSLPGDGFSLLSPCWSPRAQNHLWDFQNEERPSLFLLTWDGTISCWPSLGPASSLRGTQGFFQSWLLQKRAREPSLLFTPSFHTVHPRPYLADLRQLYSADAVIRLSHTGHRPGFSCPVSSPAPPHTVVSFCGRSLPDFPPVVSSADTVEMCRQPRQGSQWQLSPWGPLRNCLNGGKPFSNFLFSQYSTAKAPGCPFTVILSTVGL